MQIFICHYHLLYDLLDVLFGGFHCSIHLQSIQRGIMMFNLKLYAEFHDHSVVKIVTIINDDPLGYVIPTNEVMLNEPGHNILGKLRQMRLL